MSIKIYKSKEGKKLYEVYVGIKARGKMLQRRRRKDFQGNFIASLPTAKKVEFEIKRELIGEKEGQPIWKWRNWQEECLKRMKFSLKNSTIVNYQKILGKWIPKDWNDKELKIFTKADVHKLIFEDMFATTPHQKKNFHKMIMRVFEMALEEGVVNKNPVKGIKVTTPAPNQKVLTSEEASQLLRTAKECSHRFYPHWAITGMRNGELYALRVSDVEGLSR